MVGVKHQNTRRSRLGESEIACSEHRVVLGTVLAPDAKRKWRVYLPGNG